MLVNTRTYSHHVLTPRTHITYVHTSRTHMHTHIMYTRTSCTHAHITRMHMQASKQASIDQASRQASTNRPPTACQAPGTCHRHPPPSTHPLLPADLGTHPPPSRADAWRMPTAKHLARLVNGERATQSVGKQRGFFSGGVLLTRDLNHNLSLVFFRHVTGGRVP
jgi:hypothetical protein